ncbi:MAG: NfeD family protein [Sciscionella sp.]|nr:NfeD family protein [Sciscionella sp.]
MAAVVWLIIGVVFVAAEVLSGDFVLVMLGIGGLLAALATSLGAPIAASAAVFAVASIGLIVGARPALKRRLHIGHGLATNTEALIGKDALALTEVDSHGGRVKIGGDEWSAKTANGARVDAGDTVTVIGIAGATAIVDRR